MASTAPTTTTTAPPVTPPAVATTPTPTPVATPTPAPAPAPVAQPPVVKPAVEKVDPAQAKFFEEMMKLGLNDTKIAELYETATAGRKAINAFKEQSAQLQQEQERSKILTDAYRNSVHPGVEKIVELAKKCGADLPENDVKGFYDMLEDPNPKMVKLTKTLIAIVAHFQSQKLDGKNAAMRDVLSAVQDVSGLQKGKRAHNDAIEPAVVKKVFPDEAATTPAIVEKNAPEPMVISASEPATNKNKFGFGNIETIRKLQKEFDAELANTKGAPFKVDSYHGSE